MPTPVRDGLKEKLMLDGPKASKVRGTLKWLNRSREVGGRMESICTG